MLIIYIKLLLQTILLLVQRYYIKTTLKIQCTKMTTIIVRLVDVNIIRVLKFGTKFDFQSLKQGQKLWHYW